MVGSARSCVTIKSIGWFSSFSYSVGTTLISFHINHPNRDFDLESSDVF